MLSTSSFKLVTSNFTAKLDVSAPVAPFKSAFVEYLDRSKSSFILVFLWLCGSGNNSFYIRISFSSIQLLKELSKPFTLT